MLKKSTLALCLLVLVPLAAGAQAPGSIRYAQVSAAAKPAAVRPGGRTEVAVTVAVAPGFHINAVKPADPELIPTKLDLSSQSGFVIGAVRYPPSKTVKESYSPKPMLVYMGIAVIRVPVSVARTVGPGRHTITGTITYQGCNATACYPPKTERVAVSITVK